MRPIDLYYEKQTEQNKSCLLALRELILLQDAAISESLKWSIPCFSFYNCMFCFLNIEKKSNKPYLLFVEGHLLKHAALEIGSRKRMKILRVDPEKDIPVGTIQEVLQNALDLYRSGRIAVKINR